MASEQLATTRLAAAIDVLHKIQDAASIAEFAQLCVDVLPEVVPCDVVGYNELDTRSSHHHVVGNPTDAVIPGIDEVLGAYLHEHPVLNHVRETGDLATVKLTDFLSLKEFRSTGLYNELYRPLGIKHHLITHLPGPPTLTIGIALFRHGDDFDDSDRAVLDMLQPHLAHAYSMAADREALAGTEAALLEAGQSVVVLDRDGRVLRAGANAAQIIGYLTSQPWSDRLPNGLHNWVGRALREAGAGEAPSGRTRVVVVDGRTVTLRCVPSVGGRCTLLLTVRSLVPSAEHLAAMGLSARQSEVLRLVAAGLTNAQIGDELGISPRTVKRHLESVYDKLGVRTRAAAAAIAFAGAL
jgi:DNA-binding NarL/FixJ family response regulator